MNAAKILTLAPVALLSAACGVGSLSEQQDVAGSNADEIVLGKRDNGHPTVGTVVEDGQGMCTGTLIGQKTVLTAAHCITAAASHYSVDFGGNSFSAAKVVVHPNWNQNADQYEGKNDLALILLKLSPGIAPSQIASTAPFAGESITLVGYGVTGENATNFGVKRQATNTIDSTVATKFYFHPTKKVGTTCYGDSGGPAFATVGGVEVQVGITSGGETPCETGVSYDTRVDAFASWIVQTAGGDVNTGSVSAGAPAPAPDTVAPKAHLTSPTNGSAVSTSVTVTATATDNVAVVKATLSVDAVVVQTVDGAGPFTFSTKLTAGKHTLRVYAYDAAGNKSSSYVTVTAQ